MNSLEDGFGETMKKLVGSILMLVSIWTLGAVIHFEGAYYPANLSLHSICLQNNLAYLSESWQGSSAGLLILNVANPAHPVVAGIGNDPNQLYGITVSGQRAYLAAGNLGFQVWDVSVSNTPVLLSTVYVGGFVEKLSISGSRLYVVVPGSELLIYDIGGQTPVLAGTWQIEGINDVFVCGNLAYIACLDPGLCIVDVSNPSACSLLGEFDNFNSRHVRIRGNLAFLSDNHIDHFLLDISDPTNPIPLYEFTRNWLDWAYFLDNYLIVIANTPGVSRKDLLVYDISVPTQPTLIVTHSLPNSVRSSWLEGEYLYVIDIDGMSIYNLSDFSNPLLISLSNIPYEAVKVELHNDYAYIADSGHRLLQMNISNPANPFLLSQLPLPQEFMDMELADNLLYLTSNEGYLNIVGFSENDPPQGSNFELLSSISTGGSAYRLSVGDYRAYVGQDFSFKIFNVVEPESPMLLHTYENNTVLFCSRVLKHGNYLFVTGWTGQIWILDITDDFDPQIVASIPNPTLAGGMVIKDNYLYQANSETSTRIYNIANPHSPVFAGYIPTTLADYYSIHLSGGYLFVNYTQINTIVCYDLSVPASPVQIWIYQWGLPTWDLVYRNGLLYTCNGPHGFSIIRCELPSAVVDQVQTPSPPSLVGYPNPFRDTTTFRIKAGNSESVELAIYSLRGEAVRNIRCQTGQIGEISIVWDGRDDQGRQVANGIYFCRMKAGNYSEVRKLIRVK